VKPARRAKRVPRVKPANPEPRASPALNANRVLNVNRVPSAPRVKRPVMNSPGPNAPVRRAKAIRAMIPSPMIRPMMAGTVRYRTSSR
jgi:hypothetical protein